MAAIDAVQREGFDEAQHPPDTEPPRVTALDSDAGEHETGTPEEEPMSDVRVGDTPAARRAARISAAQALVKANARLGKQTDPAIVALANARSRVQDVRRVAS